MSHASDTFPLLENVSRETCLRLQTLQGLVEKWTKTINLVANSTIPDAFKRHIVDSAQIFDLAPQTAQIWADLGTGGGFPGLVIACMAVEKNPRLKLILVESDQRKATFLRHAAQTLDLMIEIRAERIETTTPINADVVSARALAPLRQLCNFTHRHLASGGIALLHKGEKHANEVMIARQHWNFDLTQIESITDPAAVILRIEGLTHV